MQALADTLQFQQVSNFSGQLDLFIGPQQANPTDFLEIQPNRVFGVMLLFGLRPPSGGSSFAGFGISIYRSIRGFILIIFFKIHFLAVRQVIGSFGRQIEFEYVVGLGHAAFLMLLN